MKSRFSLILMLALTACTSHFITDNEYRSAVADDFQSRSAIMEAAAPTTEPALVVLVTLSFA